MKKNCGGLVFLFSFFILFSCSHQPSSPNIFRSIASEKTFQCTGMYDPFLESELSLELKSNPLFLEAHIIEADQFYGDREPKRSASACYATHSPDGDAAFTKFETFIVPTSDPRNPSGYACEISSIKISKNAATDSKWPVVIMPKHAKNSEGVWLSCQ